MNMTNNTIDEYFQSCTSTQIAEYQRIKSIVLDLVPDAEETMSYGMPTFKYKKKPLLHWGAFKDHVSLFPTPSPIVELKERLEKYITGKGTLQYQENDPIPEELVKDLLVVRLAVIS